MSELQIRISIQKDSEGATHSSFSLLNEEASKGFGPWQGLPESIEALLRFSLTLEGRMQLIRIQESGRETSREELEAGIRMMLSKHLEHLLPQILDRCLLERIQEP